MASIIMARDNADIKIHEKGNVLVDSIISNDN